ncbi:SF1B family DNA helicase RecD2 [Streptococcus ruminantium]|uniref:ATP-dependent RecD2 DNA helicase n=1 Tax=Streptococcus ruminantium TaxID=1917441 RepID=A0ABU1B551_9STRE|nr:ATP-dependent RecD-like DNA helicase [Streptococcus ruminantium]MDQ8759372.1 ATP-dependent RecD-like DNA helicase [Streptococcus ruminantium]MDQ8769754.1 ATP-dependent RecD-like DNA helicase [Streptococcus ruminantium]MDQ8774499.1 ATP-dependent RecD-like DNA helicase [Streptococcus ruminantium]MDQ8794484.1 ATP-dependent RecD-like DNA helicase [Streptococcus ruminantium]MDQ8795852.1 ATP-dependent RecD-like DNA helicase [Streptococcus ruminantium]
MDEIYFTGTIDRIIFENPSNFYKILLLEIEETNTEYDDYEIIVTGTIADIIEGEDYRFYGNLITHPKYGQQLQITRYERSKPTASGLVKYFSSEHFKGIGRKTAEKIVQLYGEDTIDKILAEPEKLTQITGLSSKNKQAFIEKLRLNYGTEMILAKLAEYGIPNKLAFQIQDQYKEKTLKIIEENPYQLVEDVQGLGFTIADKIAENLGIASDSPQRFRAGMLFSLIHRSMETGDTYVEARDLLEATLELLEKSRHIELDPAAVAKELTGLIVDEKVQQEGTKIFDNSLYFAEHGIHKNLTRLMGKNGFKPFPRKEVEAAIAELETMSDLTYDTIQKEAIVQAITNPIFILTGGPGTGKTTVINGIIAVYAILHKIDLTRSREECPVLLAAPTGRAARRMNELTGLPAATIHRHLGLVEGQEDSYRDDYLEADFIVIDEFSMVDTWLANQLFQNISSQTQVLIVGDAEQLPSVSPGQVLADLLKIDKLPSITLERIYRQSDDSTIVTLASQIRQGNLPDDFREKKADRSYFEAQNEQIPAMIERIVGAAIKSGIPANEVQILAPMYRGAAGIDQLNTMTQTLLNPLEEGELEFTHNELVFRCGDRIIHLVNDAEANVFNGDLGYITDLLPAKYTDSKQDEITIDFDGSEVTYPRNEWYKITLAYAMSIHKSQGSEFQVVILPITRSSHRMLQRNLIYTAITRSRSKLILLGEIAAFDYAVKNTGTSRKTYLVPRFQGEMAEQENETTPSDCHLSKTAQANSTPTPAQPVTQEESSRPQQTHHQLSLLEEEQPETTTSQPKEFILTAENILTIDPMIGISQTDLATFFKIDS